jgi:hypothetical protein
MTGIILVCGILGFLVLQMNLFSGVIVYW